MKKNLYYRLVYGRVNGIKEMIYAFFYNISSSPRLFIEVFTRKNFGERYFKLSTAIILTVILAVLPFIFNKIHNRSELSNDVSRYENSYNHSYNNSSDQGDINTDEYSHKPSMTAHYLTWYLFLAAFVFVSIQHKKDLKRNPSVFDFGRYSKSSGQINPIFFKFPIFGKIPDSRIVETILEPLPFLVGGILLVLMQQTIGTFFIIVSICYSLDYFAAYNGGDNFVMDKIDEIIANEELEKSFVNDADMSETRGFRFMGRKP